MAGCVDGSCQIRPFTRQEKRMEYTHNSTNAQETWQALRDDLIRIGHQYHDLTIDTSDMDECLHDAWDELIHAAKVIPAGNPEHDRLVTLVLEMTEIGPISRVRVSEAAEEQRETALASNGQRLWTDLPFLARDLHQFWVQESMTLCPSEMRNLAAFTAKLFASGVCADDLAECASWLFREALETGRSLSNYGLDQDASHVTVSLADLVTACSEWMKYANFKLARLSTGNHQRISSTKQMLASAQSLSDRNPINDELSIKRWLSWRHSFGELYIKGPKEVSKPARECFEIMVSTGRGIGLRIPGEKRYLDQVFKALERELVAREHAGCVSPSDIEIDPAWAEEL